VATLQSSTLPLSNDSWRDGFVVSSTRPFQGVVASGYFLITRLETTKPVRRVSPLPLTGRIKTAAHNCTGSQLLLTLRPAPLEVLTNGVAWALAIVLSVVILLREQPNFRLDRLLFLLLPACFTAASYARLRSEAAVYERLLSPLLKLKKLL